MRMTEGRRQMTETPAAARRVAAGRSPETLPPPRASSGDHSLTLQASDLQARFEAAVKGVRAGFKHLAEIDIAHPPASWPDARFALQIALHLLVTRLGVSRRGAAFELGRSAGVVASSLRTVEERLADPAFADAYAQMADRARAERERRA